MILLLLYRGETKDELRKKRIESIICLYNQFIRGEQMQGCSEKGRKVVEELGELAVKISRLRRRLVSYGYSSEEVSNIIMQEFLKLKKIDWATIKHTARFHQIRSTYRVDSSTAEMILNLDLSVPNLHTPDVCHYLLSVLEYNSLSFGISLIDSSSDSNDSGSGLQRRIINHSKRRIKGNSFQMKQKRSPKPVKCQRGRKRVHKMEQLGEEEPLSKQEQEFNRLFMNRPSSLSLEFQDNLQKEYKKQIQSQDSQG